MKKYLPIVFAILLLPEKAFGAFELLPTCLQGDKRITGDLSCVSESITHFTSLLLWLVGFAAFGYFLYGCFQMITAFGDEAKLTQGKKTVQYALIGVIVATLAGFIVTLVAKTLGVNVTI